MTDSISRFPTEVLDAEYYSVCALTIDVAYSRSQPMDGAFYVLPPEYLQRKLGHEGTPHAESVSVERCFLNECPISQSHRTHKWYSHARVTISGTGVLAPFVECDMTAYPLVTEELASRLISINLKGLQCVKAQMDHANSGRPDRDDVYLLVGENPLPTVPRQLAPGAVNSCDTCGFSPVFCPECGFVSDPCPQCKSKLIYLGLPGTNRADFQFDLARAFPSSINKAAGAIDLKRCNERWDFSGTSTFSRKGFVALLEANAYPLEVIPLRTLFEDGTVGFMREDAVPADV